MDCVRNVDDLAEFLTRTFSLLARRSYIMTSPCSVPAASMGINFLFHAMLVTAGCVCDAFKVSLGDIAAGDDGLPISHVYTSTSAPDDANRFASNGDQSIH